MPADSVTLPDGRIALFRWDWHLPDPPEYATVVYDSRSVRWEVATFEGERPHLGTDGSFVLAGDGRLYSHIERINVDEDPWRVEPVHFIEETDVYVGFNLASGSDGTIYWRAQDSKLSETQLIGYDPRTGSSERSPVIPGTYGSIHQAGDRLFLLGHGNSGGGRAVFCDPAVDSWSEWASVPSFDFNAAHGAVGPDGRLYAPLWKDGTDLLGVISAEDGSVAFMAAPPGLDAWQSDLLWADGTLYAFGNGAAWAFTPDD